MRLGTRGREVRAVFICAGLLWGVTGCRHKPVAPPLPQITQPVPLATPPQPDNPPMVEAPPAKLPPVPVASGASRPKRERRKKPATPAAPPVQTAEASVPADVAAIGVLTSGSDSSPRAAQDAADLITANEKRLNALPAQQTDDAKAQVTKVKNFLKQAQEALRTGDTEGAKTLATKAKLLLDDIEKL